jgi:hypothetical protein
MHVGLHLIDFDSPLYVSARSSVAQFRAAKLPGPSAPGELSTWVGFSGSTALSLADDHQLTKKIQYQSRSLREVVIVIRRGENAKFWPVTTQSTSIQSPSLAICLKTYERHARCTDICQSMLTNVQGSLLAGVPGC